MIEAVLKRKGVVSLLIANGGVAISLLYGGFSFLTSIEDTAEAVDHAHYRIRRWEAGNRRVRIPEGATRCSRD